MKRNLIETVLGAVVLIIAGMFLSFAYSTSDLKTTQGYTISAKFDRVDGLQKGNDVKMSGIKVGSITGQELDPQSYLAVIKMSIDPNIKLPKDTAAKITSEGLLGGNYMSLEPGGDDEYLQDGDEIEFTQSAVDLVQLLGKAIYSTTGTKGSTSTEEPAAEAPQAEEQKTEEPKSE